MRLPESAHTASPWRIHRIAPDFRVEDVWALPGHGSREDLPRLAGAIAAGSLGDASSRAVRALAALRESLGKWLGWDAEDAGLHRRVASLRERLPADLRHTAVPEFRSLPFRSLYLLDDEFAAEIANRTMHGVLHVGLVDDGAGRCRAQMAVLVKPNGLLGRAYMAAIRPFRHLIVYPTLLRDLERAWRPGTAA